MILNSFGHIIVLLHSYIWHYSQRLDFEIFIVAGTTLSRRETLEVYENIYIDYGPKREHLNHVSCSVR